MSAPVQVTLFGSPTIMVQGEPLTINRFQIRAFLLRLAAQVEPVAREQLAQLFWPELDDARARRHLTQLLSHVRRTLPLPKLLIQTPSHVQLNQAQIWSDVVAFKQLMAESERASGAALQETLALAVDLYAGPFLDGISTPDLSDYELWLQTERTWLEHRYLDLLTLRTLHLMAEAAFAPAIDLSRRHLATDELAEDAHRRLIACYAAVGERSAALRQYAHCVDQLQRELEVEPMAETVALHQAVLRGATWAELSSLVLPDHLSHTELTSTAVTVRGSVRHTRDNLPYEPLPIIGRTAELATLAALLAAPQNRLITIVGVGGMGKTRLALAAAQAQRDQSNFPDGIYFVPLIALTEPNQIVPAILQALHLSTTTGTAQPRTPLAQLLDFLREKRLLLLLDNFEQLLDGADLVVQIERAAPGVHLLVTSRKVLGVHGEQLFPLNELPYPQSDRADAAATGGEATLTPTAYPAVQLFLQSAQRSKPRFQLTAENQADIVRVCQLVGGMPLALELAASWVTMLSAAEIGVEIAGSLDFLETEIHDLPTRHQSVRVLLDVIWQQLDAAERAIFTRFAIFQGGFTRQAAQEVAGASLRILRSLTTNLLIGYDEAQGRYSSHELLRTYGVEQLTAQPSLHRAMQERHGRYYSALLMQLEPELKGKRQQAAFAELAAEQANLQQAWAWSVAERRLELLEQAIAGLGYFYAWMGNQSDGTRIFATFVQRLEAQVDNTTWLDPADSPAAPRFNDCAQGQALRLLAEGYAWLANFTLMAGQVEQAEAQLQRSFTLLDRATALGADSRCQRALALLQWGHLARPRDLTAAVHSYEQSQELYAQLDFAWEDAYATSWLGEAQHLIGQQESAIVLLTAARHAFEQLGDQRNVARVLATIADSYLLDMADLHAAEATATASLRLWRASGDQLGIANTAVILAYAHCWLNQPDLADPLIAEALAIYRHHGDRYGECHVYYLVMVIANYRSDIERKEASAVEGLRLARELGDAKLIGDFSRGLANVYMARGDYAGAYPLHVEAMAVQEAAGVQALLPWLHVVRAYSSWKVGKTDEARDHLAYALRVSAENADVFTAVYAIFFVAQVLQAQGKLERAAELYALAQRDYMWQGSLSGDVIMVKPLLTLETVLPPAVYAAAKARGATLDLLATAAKYAVAIQDPAWAW